MCDVTHSSVWRDSFICVTWLIHMCDVTHSYVWRDSFLGVTWLIHMCDMTHSYVWHDSFLCVTWLIHMCDVTHQYVRRDSFICATWLIWNLSGAGDRNFFPDAEKKNDMCDMTHSCMCDMTHSYVWCDSFVSSWSNRLWVLTYKFRCFMSWRYGVARVRRIDKITGRFCRISSLLKGSFAKETYNFIDPTNQSNPIYISNHKITTAIYIKSQIDRYTYQIIKSNL